MVTDAERIASWSSRSEVELEARKTFVDRACEGTSPAGKRLADGAG